MGPLRRPPNESGDHTEGRASRDLACPRCGYELRGEIARWQDRCPLEGRCVECGFAFAWSELWSDAWHPWLLETDWRSLGVRRVVRTILQATRPASFWGRLTIFQPVRPLPIAAVVTVLIGLLVAWPFAGTIAWRIVRIIQNGRASAGRILTSTTSVFRWLPADLAESAVREFAGVLVLAVGMPLAFLTAPTTLGRARVRPAHIVRIWLYSLMLPLAIANVWAFARVLAETSIPSGRATRWADPLAVLQRYLYANLSGYYWNAVAMVPALVLGGLLTLWLALWWRAAARRYLRLSRPGRLVHPLLFMVALAAFAAELWVQLTIG